MANRKRGLPFDRAGGVVGFPRRMLSSDQFSKLSSRGKALLVLMHLHWTPEKPVAYGIREAADRIPCDRKTAMAVFRELDDAGFIVCIDDSLFDSRSGSKTRTWRLTWMPWRGQFPSNEWEQEK